MKNNIRYHWVECFPDLFSCYAKRTLNKEKCTVVSEEKNVTVGDNLIIQEKSSLSTIDLTRYTDRYLKCNVTDVKGSFVFFLVMFQFSPGHKKFA